MVSLYHLLVTGAFNGYGWDRSTATSKFDHPLDWYTLTGSGNELVSFRIETEKKVVSIGFTMFLVSIIGSHTWLAALPQDFWLIPAAFGASESSLRNWPHQDHLQTAGAPGSTQFQWFGLGGRQILMILIHWYHSYSSRAYSWYTDLLICYISFASPRLQDVSIS